MKTPIVFPYKMASRSGRVLAQALGTRRVWADRNYIPRSNHLIVNWGNSSLPVWSNRGGYRGMLNDPCNVRIAGHKLHTFQVLKEAGVSTPEFTTDKDVAQQWYDEGHTVVLRTLLRAHSGRGIFLASKEDDAVMPHDPMGDVGRAPLYVKYVKKQDEYRVHVFNGVVLDVQQKRKRRDIDNEDVNYQVRNSANGWVYCREDIAPASSVIDESLAAVNALGLDFGAVDVIWNEHQQQAYVLEVNCAPGIENSTLNLYTNSIRGLL